MKKKLAAIAALTQAYFLFPLFAFAQPSGLSTAQTNLGTVGTQVGGQTDLPTLVGKLITALLSVLGIVFVILVIYAGFMYLSAQGDTTKVQKANKLLTQSVIGLIIVIAAYAISNFVIGVLVTATT